MIAAAAIAAGPVARGAGKIEPGAYCPLPKENEKPSCLVPAKAEYGKFFAALEGDELADDELARVEADVASGATSERAYLALSSLSYGYFRLSQRVAAADGADPRMVARLERWNRLLGEAYTGSAEDERYQSAVREAAVDLRENAPPVTLRCVDEHGETVECDSTEVVLRGIDAAAGEVGLRAGLERLLERIVGGGER